MGEEKLDKLSLQISHRYLRDFFKKKLDNNMSGLVSQLTPFEPTEIEAPVKDKLDLVAADELIASGLKKVRQTGDAAVLQGSITNQPQIFRIHRDILYTSMSHKDRLLAGIAQQLRKGYCNNVHKEVYL